MKIYEVSEELKRYARLVVSQAQDRGLLPKPERCQICGYDRQMLAEEKADRVCWGSDAKADKNLLDSHHPNYFQPFVVWHLCRKCHKTLHERQRTKKIAVIDLRMAKALIFSGE